MNKKTTYIIGTVVTLIIIAVGYQIFTVYKSKQHESPSATLEAVHNKEFGVSFSYPAGEDGFALLEPNGAEKGILKSYIMIPSSDFKSYKEKPGGEAPAGMNIFIFALDEKATTTEDVSRITELQNWASDNSIVTAIKLAKKTPDVVDLDGVKALHYQADGLYQQDIYLLSYKARVYMFVGQYDKDTDYTYTAFQSLMKTVTLD